MAVALIGLAGCHGKSVTTASGATTAPSPPAEAAYRRPPAITSAALLSRGRVRLAGLAGPGDRVRLASPGGSAAYAAAGRDGAWSFVVAAPAEPRLFGLSMVEHGRAIQAEGYVAVTPEGSAAQLRAGAGAVVLGDPHADPAILAVDFDSKGGAVVSGRASPGAMVDLWVDGARRGRTATGPGASFSIPLDEPLSFTDHRLEVADGARRAEAAPRLSPAEPLSQGPYRATPTPSGWRIDWMTPGGGLQTTLMLARNGDAA